MTDRAVVQAACRTDGRALRHASELLKQDAALVALAVATAGRSSRYADGLAPPPKFFGLLASKMEDVADAGQQQKETKILEAFRAYDGPTGYTRGQGPYLGYTDENRLELLAKDYLKVELSPSEVKGIVRDAQEAGDRMVHYCQRTPDADYRKRLQQYKQHIRSHALLQEDVAEVARGIHAGTIAIPPRELYIVQEELRKNAIAATVALVLSYEKPGEDKSAAVRQELSGLKPSVLKKRARSAGASEEQIEEADDAEDSKAAMIALVLALSA